MYLIGGSADQERIVMLGGYRYYLVIFATWGFALSSWKIGLFILCRYGRARRFNMERIWLSAFTLVGIETRDKIMFCKGLFDIAMKKSVFCVLLEIVSPFFDYRKPTNKNKINFWVLPEHSLIKFVLSLYHSKVRPR